MLVPRASIEADKNTRAVVRQGRDLRARLLCTSELPTQKEQSRMNDEGFVRVARVRVHGRTVVCVAGFNIFDFAN